MNGGNGTPREPETSRLALAALESRTRGNLEPDEARVLQQVLADLRLNYVDELKKAGREKVEPEKG